MSNAQIAVAKEQVDLLNWRKERPAAASGATYDPERDEPRLGKTALAIYRLLCDGKEWTLPDFIDKGVPGLSSTHSARLREIRAWAEENKVGTIHDIPPVGKGGLWKYVFVRGPGPYPARGQKGRFAKTMPKERDQTREFPTAGIHYRANPK